MIIFRFEAAWTDSLHPVCEPPMITHAKTAIAIRYQPRIGHSGGSKYQPN